MSSAPKGERLALDAYYTPDDLAELLVGLLPLGSQRVVWEPHVGGGAFACAIARRGHTLRISDVDRTAVAAAMDLQPSSARAADFLGLRWRADWIIGNPPYRHAEVHVRHALGQTRRHVAFLLRTAFLESAKRAPFWAEHPARKVWVLSERPSFTPDGKTDSASYAFFWWDLEYSGPTHLEVLSWKGSKETA